MKKQTGSIEGTTVRSTVQDDFGNPELSKRLTGQVNKLKGTFEFTTFYFDLSGTSKPAVVILIINYQNRSYSVKPKHLSDDIGFIFENGSTGPIAIKNKYNLWKAVLQSINDAIDFAEKELRQ